MAPDLEIAAGEEINHERQELRPVRFEVLAALLVETKVHHECHQVLERILRKGVSLVAEDLENCGDYAQ